MRQFRFDHRKKPIPLLEGEARRLAHFKRGYIVRLFDPKGRYPKARLVHRDALYWADEDLAFFVTLSEPWDTKALPYTEMDWATAQELRLLGSILLCEDLESQRICFYPMDRFSMCLDAVSLDLSSPSVARHIKNTIYQRSLRPDMTAGEGAIQICMNGTYELLKAKEFHFDRQPELFAAISTDDHLLLRGIAALIKSEMLATHYEFWEEAIVIAFIAMEASFQMILRQLRRAGNPDPSAADAAHWLHATFNEPFGHTKVERYFEELYDQRIMTLHPANRFGITPYAPLMHDDYTLLRRDLPPIFSYLLTGRHTPEYLEAVGRFGSKASSQETPATPHPTKAVHH